HLQIAPAVSLGRGAGVQVAELEDQSRPLLTTPFHVMAAPVQDKLGARREAVGEVRQGKYLDGTIHPERAQYLTNADHRYRPVARSTNTRLRSRSEATRTRVRSASMLRPDLPISRPMSSSAILTLIAIVPRPRSTAWTSTSAALSATDLATNSTRPL